MKIDEDLAAVAAFTEAEQFADVRVTARGPRVGTRCAGGDRTATVRRRRSARGAGGVVGDRRDGDGVSEVADHDLVGRLNLVLPGRTRTVVPSTVAEAREKGRRRAAGTIH